MSQTDNSLDQSESSSTVRLILSQWRKADGISHVALGPITVALVSPLSDWLGVSTGGLVAFLIAFTAYGVVVAMGTRRRRASTALVKVGITANAIFVAVTAWSLAASPLTSAGLIAHCLVIPSGAMVVAGLLHVLRSPTVTGRGWSW